MIKSMVRANEKQIINHEEHEEHEEFWPSAKWGVGETNRLYSDFSQLGSCEALYSAIAFFMSFMLFMVKHILGSGRRPGCVLPPSVAELLRRTG